MTRRTSFLTRCFAMALALVMAFSGTNLGIVLQAYALEPAKASGNMGDLMVQQYGLDATSNFAKLLLSDDVADNEGYTYDPPTDAESLITIDAANRTVKFKKEAVAADGATWDANKSGNTVHYVVNGGYETMANEAAVEDGEYYSYTYAKDEPVRVEIKYNARYAFSPDQQIHLMENIKALKTAYDKTAEFVAVMDDGVNKLQPELGSLGQYLPDTDVAVKHGNAMSDLVYLNTMYEQAASQYGTEHDYVKSLVGVTTEVEPFLSYAYMPVENLLVSLPELSAALGTYLDEAQALVDAGQGTTQIEMAIKLGGAAINSINTYVGRLQNITRPEKGNWADIADEVTAEVLAGKTSDLNALLAGEWSIPNLSYDMIVPHKNLFGETDIATLIINGSYSFYKDGEKQAPPAMKPIEIYVAADLDDAGKLVKADPAIASIKEGMAANLIANGFTAEEVANNFVCDVTRNGDTWNVTYAPKTYTITINGVAGPQMEYGSKFQLETHPDVGEKIYEFEVVDAEGNVTNYDEGKSFIVTGNMAVTRTENKPYVTNNLYALITDNFLKEEATVAGILQALNQNRTVNYRTITPGTALSLNTETNVLSMPAMDASYGDNKWTAFSMACDADPVEIVFTQWNADASHTVDEDVTVIAVGYNLLLAGKDEVQTQLGYVDAVIGEAEGEKNALENLVGSKGDMEQLTYTKLGSIATLADGDANLTEDQQQVFVDMQDNCYDTDKNLKVYNLVVKYENGGLTAFYQDADNFLTTVQQLDTYLGRLFGTTQAEKDGLKKFLDSLEEGAGYDDLVSMKESVAKAADALVLSTYINKDASMTALGNALTAALADNTVASNVTVKDITASAAEIQTGENQVRLTIKLNAGDKAETYNEVFTKGVTMSGSQVEANVKAALPTFFEGDYTKYYTNNFKVEDMVMGANKTLTFDWEYKNFTANVAGEAQTFNAYNPVITLPAAPEGQRYVYHIGETDWEVKQTERTYTFTKAEIDALFASGSYTVEKDVYQNVTFGYTLVAPIQGVDKSAPVSITREMKVGEGYKLTEDDVDFLKLKASRGLKDQGIRQLHYYDQTGYTPESYIDTSITENTTNITYTLKVIPYTVTFVENGETVHTATISIDNLVVNLPESSDEAYYYEYLLDGVTLQDTKHEFLTPGDYTITRVTHKNDVTTYDDAARVLEKIAESDFIAKLEKGEAVKGILKSGVFTTKDVTVADDQGNLSTVKAFDENIKFNIPKNESLSLVGTKLTIPVVDGNKALRLTWNPTKYVFNTGAEGTLTGASEIVMDNSVALATVTYEMVLANNAKVIEKLAAIDDLVADGDKKIAAMDALLDLEEDLKTLSTALKTVENYTDFITDDAEYEAVSAILADMLTNCFTQNPRGGPDKLLLLDQVQKYATAKAENSGLAYIYANLNDINDAIGNLVMYMNQLKAYPNALDEMGAHEDIKDVLGEGQTLSGLLDEYSVTIADYRADLMVPAIINNSMDLTAFGKDLQALSINYTPVATADAVKDQVVVLTKEATQVGEGVLVAEVVLSIEGYPAITIIDGPYETLTGSYTLTAADLASLNGKIDAALAGLSNFNANFYATDYKAITALTINGDSEALAYSWNLKPIMVNDHEGNQTALKYTLVGTTMEIDLPAAPEGLIYDYYIGNDKYPVGISSIAIEKLYNTLGNNLVITCVATESLTYTIVLNVEGLEEAYSLELGYKKVGDKPAAVDPAEVNTAIIAALAELKVNTKFYTTDYAQNKLATSLTENKSDSFKWTYKNFKVTIDGQAHEEVSLKDLEITLPAHQDTDKYFYRYVIDGETITVDGTAGTYTFTRDQLDMLFENDTFDITRRQIKKDDGTVVNRGSTTAVIGDGDLLKDHPAGDILSSGALFEDEIIFYNDPDESELELKEGTLTIGKVTANASEEMFWTPVSYKAQNDSEATNITSYPVDIKMDPADDYVDINFKLDYLTAAQVNEKLKVADDLVYEAIDQKDTLDYLSSDDMIANTEENQGKLTRLSKSMMENVALIIDGGEFSADKATSESHKAHYLDIFTKMALTTKDGGCFPDNGDTNLTLHGMLTNYRTAGLINFYQNAAAYKTEITRLGNYLEDLMDPAHKDGLKYFLDKEGFGSYFDMISDVQQTISDAADALTLNAAIDTSKDMSALVAALEEAMAPVARSTESGYKPVAGTGTAMTAYATVRKANDGRITLTVTLKADGTTKSDYVSLTRKMVEGVYKLTDADIAELKTMVDAKAAELGFDTGDFVKYYEAPVLTDLVGEDVTPENYAFTKAWTYKNFTVNVGGVAQSINLGNLTINLPKSEDDKYRNEYEINGVIYTEDIGTYTFKKADLDTLFGEDGETAFEVAVTKINKAEEKLIKFVRGLNKEVGMDAFSLVGPEGDRTGIVANIPADGMMGMATYLMTSSEYTYVGLNGQPLLSGGMHMQALIDAMLSDAQFGSQTIIDMSNNKPAHVMDATMQLGVAADNLQYNDLTFTVNITSVPSDMKGNVDTIAGYLSDLKNVFWFNGNAETGKLDIHLNMGPATIDGRSINLEKLYEAYLTALLVTYDMQKITLDEVNQIVAVQLLKDYTACLAEDDVTIKTLENTLAKLGQDIDLSKYENYFKLAQKFHRDSVVAEDGTSVTESFPIQALLDMSGMDVSAYESMLGMIFEHKNNVDLTVGVNAILENANKSYEAVILDARAAGVQNKLDYTLDLSERANDITGESVIMLLNNVYGDVTLNGATILDLNGYSIFGTLTANGRTIIIDSANGNNGQSDVATFARLRATPAVSSYVEKVVGNATILAGTYGNDITAMLRPGYAQSNGAVTVDIVSMLNEGYFTSIPFVAAEIAVDFALNNYATAAFYACAGGHNVHTIFELGFDDFISLIDREDSLKQNAVNIVNTILDMFTMDGGLDQLINEIAAMLIDVDRIVELTKNGGTLGTIQIATRPWKFETKHIHDEDYITVGWTVNSEAPLKHADAAIKIPAIENSKIQRVLNELADIAAGTAGNPESYFEIDLKDITLADNAVNVGGGLQTYISLNFCGDNDGETDLTYHGTYNRVLAVIVAFANDKLTKDIIKNGEIVELNELMAVTTVGDFFDAIEKAVNSDKPFDYMVEKVGARLTEEEIAKLSKVYEKFQAGAGKVLAKVETKAPLAATPLSFLVDNNGVLELKTDVYSGIKNVNYRGYGLNFNLTETQVGLKIKFCNLPNEYRIVFQKVGADSDKTVGDGLSAFINDVAWEMDDDTLWLGKEKPAWLGADKAGGNIAVTYTHSILDLGGQKMLTPEQMFLWKISLDPTDSTGKTYIATPVLTDALDFVGSSVWLHNDGVNGLRFAYTVSPDAERVLGDLGYKIAQYNGGNDHGLVIDWADNTEGKLGVVREDRANMDCRRLWEDSWQAFYGEEFRVRDEYLNRDQHIRFYMMLEHEATGEIIPLYSGVLVRDIRIVAEQNDDGTYPEPYATYVKNLIAKAKQVNGETVG